MLPRYAGRRGVAALVQGRAASGYPSADPSYVGDRQRRVVDDHRRRAVVRHEVRAGPRAVARRDRRGCRVSRKLPLAEGETARTACARTVLRAGVVEKSGESLSAAVLAKRVGWCADLVSGMV